ncbi:MAG: S-adenosylmethionine:tRNA ribosyltransferase-isomerase [Desulfobacterales bacterium]|nr:S-adenosylmethionine:tRNA ribosyltransferase-isomerase [Desulfobacterales bacterium]
MRRFHPTSSGKRAQRRTMAVTGNATRPSTQDSRLYRRADRRSAIFRRKSLDALKSKGVGIAAITLHVGIGTFWPIETEIVENHVMQTEYFEITPDAAETINNARRVIAAGTTTTRTLESAADKNGHITPQSGETRLFIYPGYSFKRVNGLLTNFHLPRSSLFTAGLRFRRHRFCKDSLCPGC